VIGWAVAAASASPLVDPAGTDHLEEVERLSFSLVFLGAGGREEHAWAWRPATGEVAGSAAGGGHTFVLGAARTEEDRWWEERFLADTFWLSPALHVTWAAGGGAALEDDGPDARYGGARRVTLRYPPDAGGYSPGDAHELWVDGDGELVAWSWRPHAGAPALTATFEASVQVGPLRIATLRRVEGADLREVRVGGLSWTPAGTAISAGVDAAPVVVAGPGGCRLGAARVGRRAPGVERPLPGASGPYDEALTVTGPDGVAAHRWSSHTLGQADPWMAQSGLFGCDFGALDAPAVERELDALDGTDRGVAVAVLWAWGWGSGVFDRRLDPLAPVLRRAASSCARTGSCDAIYGALGRVR
jgi:hypothetical protein